jgi:hypothetical protein
LQPVSGWWIYLDILGSCTPPLPIVKEEAVGEEPVTEEAYPEEKMQGPAMVDVQG